MIWFAALLTIVVVGVGFWIIEKRRAAGTLTYPLWRGNLLIPWGALALVFILLMGVQELPRAIGLSERGVAIKGSITKKGDYCEVHYTYKVDNKEYTGIDSKCGLKVGDQSQVYYDPESPDASTLSQPKQALKETLIAMALISVCLPTVLVLWLMMTNVIGRRKKS